MSQTRDFTGDVKAYLAGKHDQAREDIARELGERLDRTLSGFDRQTAIELARQLADDALVAVRHALVMSVRNSRFLAKDVGMKLAYDIGDIAVPFLEVTEIFTEDELCQLVKSARQSAKAAIARRPGLTAKISAAVTRYGDLAAVSDLVENQSAEIDDTAYQTLLDRFQGEQPLFEKVARRDTLSTTIIAELITRISEKTRDLLRERYDISMDFLNPIIEESRLNALLEIVGRAKYANTGVLVRGMYDRGEVTASLVLAALRGGHLLFFEHAMSLLANIPLQSVRRLVFEGGTEATKRLCNKAQIPSGLHKDFAAAVERAVKLNA